jgi:hypothetical protein
MSQKYQARMHTDEPVIWDKQFVWRLWKGKCLSVFICGTYQEESKTLQVYRSCARISNVRSIDTASVEKWATPTFLFVKYIME